MESYYASLMSYIETIKKWYTTDFPSPGILNKPINMPINGMASL